MSKIDYDLRKIKAVAFDIDGVLSPSTVPVAENGTPMRMGNVKDGYAMQLAVKLGLELAIITGGESKSMENRMKILGIKNVWQRVADKKIVLLEWMNSLSLTSEEVAYVGDDIPDLKCLRHVGLSCCPYDAAWEVKQEVLYISPIRGGYGVARDILEQILKARNQWDTDSKLHYLW